MHYHVGLLGQFHCGMVSVRAEWVFGMWKPFVCIVEKQESIFIAIVSYCTLATLLWPNGNFRFHRLCKNQFCSNAYSNNALHEAHKKCNAYLSLFKMLLILYLWNACALPGDHTKRQPIQMRIKEFVIVSQELTRSQLKQNTSSENSAVIWLPFMCRIVCAIVSINLFLVSNRVDKLVSWHYTVRCIWANRLAWPLDLRWKMETWSIKLEPQRQCLIVCLRLYAQLSFQSGAVAHSYA